MQKLSYRLRDAKHPVEGVTDQFCGKIVHEALCTVGTGVAFFGLILFPKQFLKSALAWIEFGIFESVFLL